MINMIFRGLEDMMESKCFGFSVPRCTREIIPLLQLPNLYSIIDTLLKSFESLQIMSFFGVHVWNESVSFWWVDWGGGSVLKVEKMRKSHSVSILTFCPLNSTTNSLLHLELSSKAAHYLLVANSHSSNSSSWSLSLLVGLSPVVTVHLVH